MSGKKEKICIVLPCKIGDSILSIPFLVCFKQLIQKYKKKYSVELLCSNGLIKIFQALNIFPVKKLTLTEKIKSQFFPYDKTIFLDTSSKNMFLKAKYSLGMNNPFKKYLKFDKNLPFLDPRALKEQFIQKLSDYLVENKKLAETSANFISICLYLGFSEEQIKETFEFSQELIGIQEFQYIETPKLESKYVVCCMEAAYGKSTAKDRLWDFNNYFSIADYLYEKYELKTVFIGIDHSNRIPQKDYLIDLRKSLNLSQVAKVISNATAYIGNDTGPLHIANLLKKPSIALYGRQETEKQYSPIFPELNVQLFRPEVSEVIKNIDLFIPKSGSFQQL